MVPTARGAVVVICHAPEDSAAGLAECDVAASTLVVPGERPSRPPAIDRSGQRLARTMAALRSSRSEGRRRLAAADLAPAQARAATSLQRSHERAARSVDRISSLENGYSIAELSAALHATAAAYGRLAAAATTNSRSTYREASHAVTHQEEALRRELEQASAK
jgi:hypothetical protein